MGHARPSSIARSSGKDLVAVGPFDLVQVIFGSQAQSQTGQTESDSMEILDHENLPFIRSETVLPLDEPGRNLTSDKQPRGVGIACASPHALFEAIIGRRIDGNSVDVADLVSRVLQQTDCNDLFDAENRSVIDSDLEPNNDERRARQPGEKDTPLLHERELLTPDVPPAQDGKIRLVIRTNKDNGVAPQVSNWDLSPTLEDLIPPFRNLCRPGEPEPDGDRQRWTRPNAWWRDMFDYFFQSVNQRMIVDVTIFSIGDGHRLNRHPFDNPELGAATINWLIAAIFFISWSDPASINRTSWTHPHEHHMDEDGNADEGCRGRRHRLRVRLHDEGGNNNNNNNNNSDNQSQTIEVDFVFFLPDSDSKPFYCHERDRSNIRPSLGETAFAKRISGTNSDRPDISCTHLGDPIKAMAQFKGREPEYDRGDIHSINDLLAVARRNCVNNLRTFNPMACFPHATDLHYGGSNLMANHAYLIRGYIIISGMQ